MKKRKYIEIYKVRKDKLNLVFFEDGDAISSEIFAPSQFKCKNTDELIEKIKKELKKLKISYMVYR